jgi:hypothetical protein
MRSAERRERKMDDDQARPDTGGYRESDPGTALIIGVIAGGLLGLGVVLAIILALRP